MKYHLATAPASPNAPRLPTEILIKILYELTLLDLLRCRTVSRRFNHAISNSLLLQYRVELGIAALIDRPGKLPTVDRLERLKGYRFGWRNLAWKRRDIIGVHHPQGTLAQLSGGLFISGKRSKNTSMKLFLVELPTLSSSVSSTPRRSELECGIEAAHMAVDVDQDLLVLVEDRSKTQNNAHFRVHIRSLLTNIPHPGAASAVLEYDCKSSWYMYEFVIQIMGRHMGILFTSGVLGDSDFERLVIWDWTRGVIRGTVSMPNSRYDAFCFLNSFSFALPCARTVGQAGKPFNPYLLEYYQESINIFVFRPSPPDGYGDPGPFIRHVCSLQLPELLPGARYVSVLCRSAPAPATTRVKRRKAGIFRPDKLFEADHEDGIVTFPIHCFVNGSRFRDFTLVSHRTTLLSLMPTDALEDLFSTKTSVIMFWEPYGMSPTTDWGPQIPWSWWGPRNTRCTIDRRPPRWAYDTHGHRFAQLVHLNNPFQGHIRILDFNPFTLRRPLLGPDDSNPSLNKHVERRMVIQHTVIPADDFFQQDVVTMLPYYEVTSLGTFPLNGVLLDDERVIGMRADGPGGDDVVALDVLMM